MSWTRERGGALCTRRALAPLHMLLPSLALLPCAGGEILQFVRSITVARSRPRKAVCATGQHGSRVAGRGALATHHRRVVSHTDPVPSMTRPSSPLALIRVRPVHAPRIADDASGSYTFGAAGPFVNMGRGRTKEGGRTYGCSRSVTLA
ncbi:hypothetical protein DFH09DRAFT_1153396 [Mycena vulgaris]|nr:hypothetical protein DFH09DRAFT_1153396 [Mycena vulgaris]